MDGKQVQQRKKRGAGRGGSAGGGVKRARESVRDTSKMSPIELAFHGHAALMDARVSVLS